MEAQISLEQMAPFNFWKKQSTMFKMYIYTMGEWHFASGMAKFSDPENVYLKLRIIAYEYYRKDERVLIWC